MSQAHTKRFDISKYKDVSVKSFRLRELSQDEEDAAYERATTEDGKISSRVLDRQLVSQALVEIDDVPVAVTPCGDWLKWNSRTRDLLGRAYTKLHGLTKQEIADFEKAASE